MGTAGLFRRREIPEIPTIDFSRFPDEALLRSREFLRPGPVPMGRTLWHEMAADGGRWNGRPWSSSVSTYRTTAKVAEPDKMADIPGEIFKEYDRQLAVI